jgi:hypothetical protein
MPVSGQEIIRQIDQFAAKLRSDEQQASQAAQTVSADIDRIVVEQSGAFRELATIYLPHLNDDVVQDGWSEMQSALTTIQLRKADARQQLERSLHEIELQRLQVETQIQHLGEQVNQLTLQCDQVAETLSLQLRNDSRFQMLSKQAAEGQAKLEQAEASLVDVEADSKQKRPAYEASPLFQYLLRREFGSDRYRSVGIIRRLDRWVARLINYPVAEASYRFLTATPQLMRQLIADQQKSVQALVAEVEQLQRLAAQALGLPQLQADGTRLRSELDRATQEAHRIRAREDTIRRDQAALDSAECQYYLEALTTFQDLLKKAERTEVVTRANQTPGISDDQVVARLQHLDREISAKTQEICQFNAAAKESAARASRIHELASKCRRAQFDHPRRVFDDGLNLESTLQTLAHGHLDADSVYQDLYRRQHLDSPMADQAAAVLESPMANILLQTMAHAAGAALGAYAARAGQTHRLPKTKNWF